MSKHQKLPTKIEALADAKHNEWLKRLLHLKASRQLFHSFENEIFVKFGDAPATVLVASATAGEGRSSIVAALATLAAVRDGLSRTLIIDIDPGKHNAAAFLGIPDESLRLDSYFKGEVHFEEAIAPTSLNNLFVAGMGRESHRDGYFSYHSFEKFVAQAKRRFNLVLVDSPCVQDNKGVIALAKILGTVLLVVRYGGPTREQVQPVVQEFERVGASSLGVVLNKRIFPIPNFLYGR